MNCKYKQEQDLLYTYDDDLHDLNRSIKALNTGKCLSPALDESHFKSMLDYFNIDLNGTNILSLGAGHGVLDAFILSNFDCTITAVEFSKKRCDRIYEMAELVSKRNKILVFNLDIHKYLDDNNNTIGNSFDVVMAFEVIEHLVNQREVVDGIKQILAPDGDFIGSVPIQPNFQQKQHITPFSTKNEVRDRLDVEIFKQSQISLRLDECRAIHYKNI